MKSNSACIPYRIRIGVTGHRRLDRSSVSKKVRLVLDRRIPEIFDECPRVPMLKKGSNARTTIHFCVITSLAEGADRIVAKEVLKTVQSRIEVILPLSKEDYLNDFSSKASKKEFEALLKKDPTPRILRTRTLKEQFPGFGAGRLKEERDQAYNGAGEYIVDHCDVLMAVWDGQDAEGRGGTGDIVAYARKRGCPLVIIPAKGRNVLSDDIVIEKRRFGNSEKEKPLKENEGNGLCYGDFLRMEKYNAYPIDPEKLAKEEKKNAGHFFGSLSRSLVDKKNQRRIAEAILPQYTRASIIAQDNRRRYFLAGLSAYVLSPLAVVAVVLGIHFPGKAGIAAFIVESAILLTILYVIFISNRGKVHKKWIETRFLSERLRSSIYLAMFGVKPAAFDRQSMRRTSLLNVGWPLRAAYEVISDYGRFHLSSEFDIHEAKETIRTKWILPQIQYHAGKKLDSGKKSRVLELGGKMIFGAAVLAALTHVFLSIAVHDKMPAFVENGIVALAILLPAFGSAIGAIRTHREYARLEKHSGIMKSNLEDLLLIYDKIRTREQLIMALQAADETMLQETQDWLMLMKPVELNPI
jgi:hypothetical protein